MTPTAGLVIADRFRLVRAIGEGKMGTVWLADHLALDIPCAVKLIQDKAQTNEEARARFEREGKAAAQLRSPHVVQIFDYGVFEDTPYIATELLRGESLEERLERVGRLTNAETFAILSQIGRALNKAHKAGIVHRDLKPANVFIVHDEDDGEIAKVVDFGVAKEQGLNMTKSGALMGTPAYMSPEQAVGSTAVDHRSDLWALGVLAFKCLTGQRPFAQKELVQVLMAIVKGPIPLPSTCLPGLPAGFDAWWTKAVARPPEERFQSAKDQIDALRAALELVDESPPIAKRREPAPLAGTMAMAPPPAAATLLAEPSPAAVTQLSRGSLPTPAPLDEPLMARVSEPPTGGDGSQPKSRTGVILGIAALALAGIALAFSVMGSKGDAQPTAEGAPSDTKDQAVVEDAPPEPASAAKPDPAPVASPPPPASESAPEPGPVAPSPVPRTAPIARPVVLPPPVQPPPVKPPPKPKDRIGF